MPRYKQDISENLITEQQAKDILRAASSDMEQTLICIAWLTGARTSEILALQKKDVIYNTTEVKITLPTLKLGENTKFRLKHRTLSVDRGEGTSMNIFLEILIRYVQQLPAEQTHLFACGPRWATRVINRASFRALGKTLTIYHFRHSALTREAQAGASINQLMHMKGATNIKSISYYMHASTYKIRGVPNTQ